MTTWSKLQTPPTIYSGSAPNKTSWDNPIKSQTTWTLGTVFPTEFQGRDITNLGAIMDDSVYIMDSGLINLDDAKLNPTVAPSINWT